MRPTPTPMPTPVPITPVDLDPAETTRVLTTVLAPLGLRFRLAGD